MLHFNTLLDSNQIGLGLRNLGNSCYLNSTMQALFHIPAFAQWLLSYEEHEKNCDNVCFICILLNTFKESRRVNLTGSIDPQQIYSKFLEMSSNFNEGAQEDAHECFLGIIEAINNSQIL